MRRFILALSLFAAFTAYGQTRHRAVPASPAVPPPTPYLTPSLNGPWLVEITTTGGIGGFGAERDVRVESNGRLTVGLIAANGKQCRFELSQEQVLEAFRVVLNARAEFWFASYLPANVNGTCCDLIVTTIRMQRQELDSTGAVWTSTYKTDIMPSTNRPNFPLDLIGLYNVIENNFDKYNDQCR